MAAAGKSKKVTASKKKAAASQLLKTRLVKSKQKKGYKARRIAVRRVSLQELMGEPYSGGELVLRSASVMVVDQGTGEPLYARTRISRPPSPRSPSS